MNTATNVTPITTPDITVSLANSTLLVKLTTTMWTANVRDKKASLDVVSQNQVKSRGAARVHKSLLPDSALHAEITRLEGQARRSLKDLTLPWSDGGDRILNVALLPKFMEIMEEYEKEFYTKVELLLATLANEIAKASFSMGSLYDPADYPSEDEIRSKYSFKFVVSPIPRTSDFRVDMPAEMASKVKGAYQQAGDERVAQAMSEAWDRLHKKLVQLLDRLTSDDEGNRKRFSNGLLESAHELVDTLQYLNIGNDFELEQARVAMKKALRGLSTEQVKGSVVARLEVAEAVKNVQDKFALLQM